jgi:hypothetical protein
MSLPSRKELLFLAKELDKIIPDLIKEATGNALLNYDDVHQDLYDRWYASLDLSKKITDQSPDWSIYADPGYLTMTVFCFSNWSKRNALATIKFFNDLDICPKSIVDVFGGNGQSTVLLAKAFPTSEVIYFNTDAEQPAIVTLLKERFKAENLTITNQLSGAECVCAFDAMEHLVEPCNFIHPILTAPETKFYIDSSSFASPEIGHFPEYVDFEGNIWKNDVFKRRYSKFLKSIGYLRCDNKDRFFAKQPFNGRPTIYVHKTFSKSIK